MNPLSFLKNLKAEKATIELSIASYQQAELHWNEKQALDWIQNVLNERYSIDTGLYQVLSDGTVLCRLLAKVDNYVVPKQHRRKNSHASSLNVVSLGIERLTFFLEGCKHVGITALFEPLDILENRNMRQVIACLEQLMKRTRVKKKIFHWKAKKVQIMCATTHDWAPAIQAIEVHHDEDDIPNKESKYCSSSLIEMEISPQTQEQHHFGLFVKRSSNSNPEDQSTKGESKVWLDDESLFGDHDLDQFNDKFLFCRIKKQVVELLKSSASSDNTAKLNHARATMASFPTLLKNDQIRFFYHNVSHMHRFEAYTGDLYITKYHLMFVPFTNGDKSVSTCSERGFKVPIASIFNIIKCAGMNSDIGKFHCFQLQGKDFHMMNFSYLDNEALNTRRATLVSQMMVENDIDFRTPLYEALDKYIFVDHSSLLAWANCGTIAGFDGWKLYSPEKEFKRLDVPDNTWRISEINKNYNISSTYPALLVVPTEITDTQLLPICVYRSKGRIPTLCWRHPNGTAMLRCSQPLTGLMSRRCPQEALYFEVLFNEANPYQNKVMIYDARPRINAVANQIMGKGVEVPYPNTEIRFGKIENIHIMRDVYKRLWKACLESKSMRRENHLRKVTASAGWLEHIEQILQAALEIVGMMDTNKCTVVVHCSDGWDRTPQLTALAQIIMDPYYRTLEGFEVLIEKEWLSFGHKFEQRVGHVSKPHEDHEKSPIFLQFLDAVFQLQNLYPNAFEFLPKLLHTISTNVYTCSFGTFLFNSEKERVKAEVKNKTISLWSHIHFHKRKFLNPSYTPVDGTLCHELGDYKFQLWKDQILYWHQYHEGFE